MPRRPDTWRSQSLPVPTYTKAPQRQVSASLYTALHAFHRDRYFRWFEGFDTLIYGYTIQIEMRMEMEVVP